MKVSGYIYIYTKSALGEMLSYDWYHCRRQTSIFPIFHKVYSSSPEPLLSSCVPELQLDPDPRFHLQEVDIEVYTHRLVDAFQE